jgi:hypothetical protein
MIESILLVLILLSFTSCGELKVSPVGCQSNGVFGSDKEIFKLNTEKTYYALLVDSNIKLNELVDCKHVERMKVTIQKKLFFIYKVKIDFTED